ncbi:hypothetical protein [Bradyrhizobium cenepequi]|nr:hypothetical protein [Bradyrhizobium cenepequi]MCA6107684.1 hypothetical protein [Bradyrhizobium cenepequi]
MTRAPARHYDLAEEADQPKQYPRDLSFEEANPSTLHSRRKSRQLY